jgi:hypothetical protein
METKPVISEKNQLSFSNSTINYEALSKLDSAETKLVTVTLNSIPFRFFDAQLKKSLAIQLNRLSFFVGIKEPIETEQLKMLTNYLVNSFPSFTREELNDAVMKSCSGELGETIEHYQNFSPVYLGKIINLYSQHCIRARTKYIEECRKSELQKKKDELEKAYDPKKGFMEMMILEHQRYKLGLYEKKEQETFIDWSVKSVLRVGMKQGFFAIDSKEQDAKEIIVNFFDSLQSENEMEDLLNKLNTFYDSKHTK